MKRLLIWWWNIIKQYLRNCNIHGIGYTVDENLSYVERLFWLFCCVLCWYGCAITINNVLEDYHEYHAAVTGETTYLDWETPFPAIAFCISSTKTIKSKYFKRNPGMFTNYSNPSLLQASAEELLAAYKKTNIPCTEFLAECTWNNKKFNCCSEFQVIRKTGIGHCIAMNTLHVKKMNEPSVRFFVNRTVKYGDVIIDIHINSKTKAYFFTSFTVHVFNNLQLPMLTNIEKDEIHMKPGKTTLVQFIIQDTINEDGVKKIAIDHRFCRFPDEKQANGLFDIYSSDSCYLEMIIERMIKLCGCVHFYYFVPKGARACNGTEMLCIIANKTEITSQAVKNEQCYLNCEGTSVILNGLEPYEHNSPDRSYSRIHFSLLSHPTVRYRRYVVNDILDVTVSVGSVFGLFMGASILSFFEIPYWLFYRRDKLAEVNSS
ncbi:pickpocket protein 11 [Osmia bicornis bicornis]|uniref:pickpocket protein 11 n=1 Tax=Osmia bicornis bicornis TaxID=1437191 RepID=UPI0010F72D1C|nr:pickpocket protein 11 [Osmia bicornis bicornis]